MPLELDNDKVEITCPDCGGVRLVSVESVIHNPAYRKGKHRCYDCSHKSWFRPGKNGNGKRKKRKGSRAHYDRPDRVVRRPAEFATRELPGTPEKVIVMMNRENVGQELYHPDDPTLFKSDRIQAWLEAIAHAQED